MPSPCHLVYWCVNPLYVLQHFTRVATRPIKSSSPSSWRPRHSFVSWRKGHLYRPMTLVWPSLMNAQKRCGQILLFLLNIYLCVIYFVKNISLLQLRPALYKKEIEQCLGDCHSYSQDTFSWVQLKLSLRPNWSVVMKRDQLCKLCNKYSSNLEKSSNVLSWRKLTHPLSAFWSMTISYCRWMF